MARPKKTGLEYFSLDTTWDVSMRLLKAKYGLQGIGCMVELYKNIYQEGYYAQWDADAKLLFAAENHIDIALLDDIVSEAVARGMFDGDMLKAYQILTSRGIQKRWRHIMGSTKRHIELDKRFDLLTVKLIGNGDNGDTEAVSSEKSEVSSEETSENSEFSTQSKGKESKGNKNKENDIGVSAKTLFSDYYERYNNHYNGANPPVPAVKAMSVLKSRLASSTLSDLQKMLDEMWNDGYICDNGHAFGLVFGDVTIAKWRGKGSRPDPSKLNL